MLISVKLRFYFDCVHNQVLDSIADIVWFQPCVQAAGQLVLQIGQVVTFNVEVQENVKSDFEESLISHQWLYSVRGQFDNYFLMIVAT